MEQGFSSSMRSKDRTAAIEYGLTAGLVASAAIAMVVLLKGDLIALLGSFGLQ